MKAYITKYALTAGIMVREGRMSDNDKTFISEDRRDKGWPYFRAHEWSGSQKEAEARFEELRDKRISSLKKQIAKLEKIKPFYQKESAASPVDGKGGE